MSKLLTGVALRPHKVALGGALGGLLAAVGRDLPQAYVMGVSGLGFRLTLDLVASPSAPVEINFHEQLPLWENMGVWFKRVAARPTDENFAAIRDEALRLMRESIDAGRPVLAYDLMGLPEYGLVVGYDDSRLACLTLASPTEPQWMETATWPPATHAQFTRAEAIRPLDVAPSFDARKAEVASLRFAVEHFWAPQSRDMWLQHGKGAYEFWAASLGGPLALHGQDPSLGHSYNLVVLQRSRQDAAAYLHALAAKYPEAPLLAKAALHYEEVAQQVAIACAILPFPGSGMLQQEQVRGDVAHHLRIALGAERQGVDCIETSLRALR